MPEGPEHFKAAAFVNKHCQDRSFTGKIVKSEVNHRNPEIDCQYETYTVSAKARGKEVMVTVTNLTLDEKKQQSIKKKGIVEYCSLVPFEVMVLEGGGYDKSEKDSDYSLFENWLQCYYNKDMNNLVDHDGRTMWFQGEPGPLVPIGEKAKARHNAKVIVPAEDNKKKTKRKSKNNTKKNTESKRSLKKSDAQPKEKLARGRKKGSIKKEENADLVEECDNKDPNAKTKSVKTTNKKGTGNRKRSIKKEATDVEVKDEKVIKIDDSHLRRSSRLKK